MSASSSSRQTPTIPEEGAAEPNENANAAEEEAPENPEDETITQIGQEEKPKTLLEVFKERISLTGLKKDLWKEHHDERILEYIDTTTNKLLVAFIDVHIGLIIQDSVPGNPVEDMTYFIKTVEEEITVKNFSKVIQYGTVNSQHIESLLRMMSTFYAPVFFESTLWPETIRNEFSSHLHKILASLTDARWKIEGKTVLYVPIEGRFAEVETLVEDKDYLQRMEAAVIHWTRQIKEVLSIQDGLQVRSDSGPLDEIEFWKNRCDDLVGISTQLNKPMIQKISKVLQISKSSYIGPFLKLSEEIINGSKQAESNLKFLQALKDPCYELADAKPEQIPGQLPRILNIIRMIWNNSEFYNTRERITSMLRKISNEVIRRCTVSIDLDRIFDGYVTSSKKLLNSCITCCEQWEQIYDKTEKVHRQFSNNGWKLDKTSIFAQVEAFIQRCRDLLEVCDCQQFFGRVDEGQRTNMPIFAGERGREIQQSLLQIENLFQKKLDILRGVKPTILDVKSTTWHDDFNKFRSGIKDLEVMMQNVINTSFETVRTTEQGVEVLDVFMHLSARENIRRTIDKKTSELTQLFMDEINSVKKEFTQRNIKWPFLMPNFAGEGHWARHLKRRLQSTMGVLDRAFFLPSTGVGKEAKIQHAQFTHSVDEHVRKTFNEWTVDYNKESGQEPSKLLEYPVMARSVEHPPMIYVNFDQSLQKLFQEVYYWERLSLEPPHYMAEAYQRRLELWGLRESVMLVVRDYNRIISMLSTEERSLFKERLKELDKKIHPGLFKLTWASKNISEIYVGDCRVHASRLQQKVDMYKTANAQIAKSCVEMSQMLLLRVNYASKLYENLEFEEDQRSHRSITARRLHAIHEYIVKTMFSIYEVFAKDGPDVQNQWKRYTKQMDAMLEEGLRLNIKYSLQELNKAINGDGKSNPNPIFKVKVILKNDKIEFSPTLAELTNMIGSTGDHLTNAIMDFKRLPDLLTRKKSQLAPIHENIANDREIKKTQENILKGLQSIANGLANYLSTWDGFREIWEINKDGFIRRYALHKPPVASFDGDISRYTEVANNVQVQETILNIQFCSLDCSPLKYSILGHCQEWQNKFTSLLLDIATQQLRDVVNYIDDNSVIISKNPTNLTQLGESLALLEKLFNGQKEIEQQFIPLQEQFAILDKYEVEISEDIRKAITVLPKKWTTFQHTLMEADEMLKRAKDRFKSGLLQQSEEFKRNATQFLEDFMKDGPFSGNLTSAEAFEKIGSMRSYLQTLKDQDAEIRKGLGLFRIDFPMNKDIQVLEKQLDQIESVWKLTKEWEDLWQSWKFGRFADLKAKEMEDTSSELFKKFHKMSRELRSKNWEILTVGKNKLDQFRRTMPLIADLRNDAMRSRHWEKIKNQMNIEVDETSDEFTLEFIMNNNFADYSEFINDISQAATREYAIELALKQINTTWENTELDLAPYKEKGHYKLRSTEEVFQNLEDNQVQLSTMKASRFVKAFEQDVDYWERTLSHILEAVELLLTVQRQWMYLENIFFGDDIRKQLPRESAEFDEINIQWKEIMTAINRDKNALRACRKEGLMKQLNDMNTHLEEIQKSLDMYLETKRQIFPRFYFISNDDLLEILGQSKNPETIQPHVKKLFDNINRLKINKAPIGQRFDGVQMTSADGEAVDFANAVNLQGPVEGWLKDVERMMQKTLKESLKNCRAALKKNTSKRDKWIKEWPGQMCITSAQIHWTGEVAKALLTSKERSDKKILKTLKKKQVVMLNKFTEAIRGSLTKLQRLKIVALVTIEVHQRDIIEKMYKAGIVDSNAFEWLSQLRFYWDKDLDDCVIRQTNTSFPYGYEFLGNSGRLVITPLTDRCYMTLTTALHLNRGGSPKGPAGTGKTETVKDLGKALANYVIVINCSEGLDFKSMGRMFSGLSQAGAWGCFDEFNRINIEVLSVVAQQILTILSALAAKVRRFVFEGREIALSMSCGLFITMNPGYAGRTELPDNLKSMFRPIAMVKPDSNMIAEIILFGEGFGNTKILAKKVYTLYSLAVQQLSKQDHYDFGLRALVSVLRYAGKKKRVNPNMADEEVLLLAMKDMNLPKMTAIDLPLFSGIMSDLFPGIESPSIDYSKLLGAIEAELKVDGLQKHKAVMNKMIQLYETKSSRHSTMIVGRTQSGKSVTWQMLQRGLSRLSKEGDQNYRAVKEYPLNPKALSLGELYGEFDLNTNEWTDGALSSIMRITCSSDSPDEKWIVFDGPVDTLWIESMNSVMDDNKILTLINGERIGMPELVSLLFEVDDLSTASPATVSRCGMVYNDYADLGWEPYVESWLDKKTDPQIVEELRRNIGKYLAKTLEFKRRSCRELIPTVELNCVASLCKLFDCLATKENGVDSEDLDNFMRMVELWFQFCMMWSVSATVDEDGRRAMDNFIREIEGTFPNKDSIYEYYVDIKAKAWNHWEEKLKGGWKYNPQIPFYKIFIPTVDTTRYNYIVSGLIAAENPVLLVGPVGTGKTSVAQYVINSTDDLKYSQLLVNMSAQTTSINVQDIIESRVEKRTKGVYVPYGGKTLITFMDDLNVPAKDTFGSQPPLELIRMWLDYGFWYDRQKQTRKMVKDMILLAAMGPPGGGRTNISARLQTRFNLINMTFPHDSQIMRIYGSMISQKLLDFNEDVKPYGELMTKATIELYKTVIGRFLPTPTKIHYLFNLRDMSRVFQGLLRAHPDYHDTPKAITRLWIHECFRVFSDRLVDDTDREDFIAILSDKIGNLFNQTYHNLCPNKQPPVFVDFVNQDEVYEDVTDISKLKTHMVETLLEYNLVPGVVQMDLVLFKDAVQHISRIVRVIRQPLGNMLLIGIGGSGRQSLTRLASYICFYQVFQIEVTTHYRKQEFRDDLKKLFETAGVDNKPTVFLLVDTQVVEEAFLEDVNNVLSSGEVPNLFKADEFEEIRSGLEEAAKKEGIDDTPQTIFKFLIDRVRANLHVVLCLSPVGEAFRNRIRMYPALVNCTTIDWFSEWPSDALLEVSNRYVADIRLPNEAELGKADDPEELEKKYELMRPNLSQTFVIMHKSVNEMSKVMLEEMRRYNYTTPSNFLELVSGYKELLYGKRKELGEAATKLRNGLGKIEETRIKVEAMGIELEQTKNKVAQFQKECEEYLVIIVQQKREADEQQKSVQQKREKIKEDEARCKQMAEVAQADLEEVLPILEEAIKALESLNKKDITEIKSYGKPPALVEMVLEGVMILRQAEPTWAEAKRHLGQVDFINQLVSFNKDAITDRTLKKIGQYVSRKEFDPDAVGRVSTAARSLCLWVRAMENYGRLYRIVEPKRQRLAAAEAQLREKQAQLADAERRLRDVEAKMEKLKLEYDEKLRQKEELRKKAEFTEMMLDRASKLVEGLAGERERWKNTADDLEERMGYLIGDCLVAAAFLSYMGPFLTKYRDQLVNDWLAEVRKLEIPCSHNFEFCSFMTTPTQVREWNIQGLPSDNFSTENGVIVTRGSRWPLVVDPQMQAVKWIKRMDKKLNVIDLQQSNYMSVLERSIQFGLPLLCQNVGEKLDPTLDPVLNKSVIKVGGVPVMRLGDKEVEYNPDFKFYMTTKLSNPHYTPEITTKANIVNFAVKESGLEAQLLGIVVRKEQPELEQQKDALVISIANGKNKLVELEDEILRLLNEAQGSLLDDEQLVNTLQSSKSTSQDVSEQLQTAEQTEAKIDQAREGYRPCAQRASILFFVLNDMSRIDPMYQYSLDSYIQLFLGSIEKSLKSPQLDIRLTNLNDFHTYSVYRFTCRGLFERHKLLFSFHMCCKILEAAGKLNSDEYSFFLRGGIVVDRENQMDNPCPTWLSDAGWDNITELEKLPNFHGIISSFEQYPRDWNLWYTSAEPETATLPAEWDNACNELQRMIIVRSLRSDRIAFCVTTFIVNNLGSKFVEPPVLDMTQVVEDSTTRTPLIFVLSAGVDPTGSLLQLAEARGMGARFYSLSLGQGQAPIATRMIKEGVRDGHWVFLANCHLSLSWMPQLNKLVDQLQIEKPHPDFRLWLSSSPHPEFPISILQAGIKITTEPPKGLKANMKRLYQLITEQQFTRCQRQDKYRKLLFSLCFFHSVLLERRKFLMLGWNIRYEFNDSDFEVSENLLNIYLDEYEETPWEALKYLVAGINYGGHVTDDWDRRLLHTYMSDYFTEDVLAVPFYKLSSLPTYYIPKDGQLTAYREYVSMLPNFDHPEAFGQHPNADITSQIQETRLLLGTVLSLQEHVASGPGESIEDTVLELASKISEQIPDNIDYELTRRIISAEPSPLNVVLLQEIEMYNDLMDIMRESLSDLTKAINGTIVMSSDLESILKCVYDGEVPPSWSKVYPSMKPLASWTRDLVQRVDQLRLWAQTAHPPKIFWLSGFAFPTGFLTAVLQKSARQNNVSVDSLSWEFTVMTTEDANILQAPKDGVLIKGLFLQGAGWDMKKANLIEASPMQLDCQMPTIHFKPVESKKKLGKGTYVCPCYYYPNRSGTAGRASFVVAVELRSGEKSPEHWIKRGTAILMSLDT